MHVHRYERTWIAFGVAMLAVFLATITTAAFLEGFVPPSHVQSVDPANVARTAPFDRPGLRKVGPNAYEAYYVGHIFAWEPSRLAIPLGAHVTFFVTATDVVHGFSIPQTDVNTMVSPGWVSTVAHTFRTSGTYLLLCNEYCGGGHQLMAARIDVR